MEGKPYVNGPKQRNTLIDHLIGFSTGDKDYESCRNEMIRTLRNLKPGLLALYTSAKILRRAIRQLAKKGNEYKVFKRL